MLLHFLIFCLFFTKLKADDKLIFVMTHFRHGARSPTAGGIDSVSEEWEAPMELTGVGKRMQYLLGLRNRIRYINEKKFLSEKYKSNEISVYTSLISRTIMSALSHLQGLYPQSEKLGENLTEAQLKTAFPPVNINYPRIQEEQQLLKNNALYDCMTTIQFETIDVNIGINMYEINGCSGLPRSSRPIYNSIPEIFIKLTNEFEEKYKDYFNEFNGRNESYHYIFNETSNICDNFVAGYVDGRNFTKLKATGIDIEEFYNYCLNSLKAQFRERYLQNNNTLFLSGTKMMNLLINNTKKKIDEDIKGNNTDSGSPPGNSQPSPKMIIISGHDTTLSIQQIFLLNSFGLSLEDYYRFPSFASQITFEITRNNDEKINRTYSDYFVNYYFNDELLLNVSAEEFFNKVEPNIWNEEKINSFCFSTNDNNSTDNASSNDSTPNDDNINNNNSTNNNGNGGGYIFFRSNKNDKKTTAAMIVFICLFGVSLLTNIILLAMLCRKNSPIPQITQSEFNKTI